MQAAYFQWFQRGMLACLIASGLAIPSVDAKLIYTTAPFRNGQVILRAQGVVDSGDAVRLHAALGRAAAYGQVASIAFDSPGGNVAEGIALAREIRRSGLPLVVAGKQTCASICFLIFAAAPVRYVARTARVGVHSASDASGGESPGSRAATTVLARAAAGYGVPSEILEKMIATAPGRMAWLTDTDLASMGVIQYDPD
ncbi:MAG: hypothetical protein H7251_05560 [Acetobacteraceae bacterium]|nr:hypothetical protein [Acetobacteraceae bacterium]